MLLQLRLFLSAPPKRQGGLQVFLKPLIRLVDEADDAVRTSDSNIENSGTPANLAAWM